jgi:type I restriction enzyme M protein
VPAGADSTNNHAAFIWSVADLLRGDYKQSEYGRVILPLTVLRRLDCVLAPVKAKMLAKYESARLPVPRRALPGAAPLHHQR